MPRALFDRGIELMNGPGFWRGSTPVAPSHRPGPDVVERLVYGWLVLPLSKGDRRCD